MRQSWEAGRFWLIYAIRKEWTFDFIFRKSLHERFLGKRLKNITKEAYWGSRIDLLTDKEREATEPSVEKMLNESKERILVDGWDEDEGRRRSAEALFDE